MTDAAIGVVNRGAERTRLLKKCERMLLTDDVTSALKRAAEEALMNEIGVEATTEFIAMDIRSLLPPIHAVQSIDFLRRTSNVILVLKQTADLYDCLQLPQQILDGLDESTKEDFILMLHVWLAWAIEPKKADQAINMSDARYWESKDYSTTMSMDLPKTLPSPPRVFHPYVNLNTDAPKSPSLETVNSAAADAPAARSVISRSTGLHQKATAGPSKARPANFANPTNFRRGGGNGSSPHGDVRLVGTASAGNVQTVPSDSHKKASSVSAYFRDSRFSGKKDESIHRTIRDFNVCAMQYELTHEQKSNFFINAFAGAARD